MKKNNDNGYIENNAYWKSLRNTNKIFCKYINVNYNNDI